MGIWLTIRGRSCLKAKVLPVPAFMTKQEHGKLNLGGYGVGNKLASVVAQSIMDTEILDLTSIDVSRNGLEDDGADAIIRAAGNCDSLTALSVAHNKLGTQAVEALGD